MSATMPREFWEVFWNVVGGGIVAILIFFIQFIRKKINRRAFRKVFGDDVEETYHLIYPSYQSPSLNTTYTKPASKVPRRTSGATNLTIINSTAATRTVNHLAFMIGSNSNTPTRIISDIEADTLMDISFISIGSRTSHKTVDLFDNKNNIFIDMKGGEIQSRESGEIIIKAKSTVDFGIIVKINPLENPKRTWLCCAGFGEWGTSGAAWWLSRNWKKIYKRAKDRPFACITSTKVGSDDSTRMIHLFLSAEDVVKTVQET